MSRKPQQLFEVAAPPLEEVWRRLVVIVFILANIVPSMVSRNPANVKRYESPKVASPTPATTGMRLTSFAVLKPVPKTNTEMTKVNSGVVERTT